MTICKRRCLLTFSVASWGLFAASLFAPIAHEHILCQQGLLGVAVTLTLAWVLLTAVTPAVAAMRAILAAKAGVCPVCNPLRTDPAERQTKSLNRL
jgi:hypothetical protein